MLLHPTWVGLGLGLGLGVGLGLGLGLGLGVALLEPAHHGGVVREEQHLPLRRTQRLEHERQDAAHLGWS